ncbi:hypothetical protein Vadar_023745 [Vaccinium darrowii]|nr:hypothetical protein Vadar_023745 [Vaccinium darrowii]
MDSKQSSPKKVLMLPWLAYGHITPFLELAKKLSTKNFHVYLCSTPVNLSSIQHRITETQSLSIKLVPLHLPPSPELPPHHHTTNGLPPHLLPTLKNVFDLGSAEFCKIVQTLSPDLVIYDFLQPWAPTVALEFNVPAVEFVTTGAAAVICYLSFLTKPNVELPFPELQLILQCFHPFRNAQPKMAPVDDGGGDRTRGEGRISSWLELSGVNFIWVVRFPMGEGPKIEEAQLVEFLDRIGKRGLVVDGWAPQAQILAHSSTGGFLSHCGWNSTLESLKFGVPIIAMPMNHDQPINGKVLEDVGVGVEVKRDANRRINRENIAQVITKVVKDESGANVRTKAREFSEIIRMKGEKDIDRMLEEWGQLCNEGKWFENY